MAREKFPSDEVDRLMLRFPAGMRERIAEAAKANNRSMNAEIVSRLQQSLDGRQARPQSDLLTPEGLEAMRDLAADTKQTLRDLLASLDRAEALIAADEARERTKPQPD